MNLNLHYHYVLDTESYEMKNEAYLSSRVNRNRGSLAHYVIRTIEQEFHVLAYEDPTVENLGKAGDTGVRVEIVEEAE
ncbi:hypothetical protein OKS35_00820 [Exiguobacterium sp. N5]|uniref:hypothetical protein n=1 Tax=Exiguobacterium sp. N5 TaxID=2990450 RepID=UPI0021F3FD0B|nr:hypothetical protein [Exiguobacterium sp. N5]MCV9898651.1 hypothetical protein [Exiguobacterium sp. N5]